MKKNFISFWVLAALLIPSAGFAFGDEDYIAYQMDLNRVLFIYAGADNQEAEIQKVEKKHRVDSPEFQEYDVALKEDVNRYWDLHQKINAMITNEKKMEWLREQEAPKGD